MCPYHLPHPTPAPPGRPTTLDAAQHQELLKKRRSLSLQMNRNGGNRALGTPAGTMGALLSHLSPFPWQVLLLLGLLQMQVPFVSPLCLSATLYQGTRAARRPCRPKDLPLLCLQSKHLLIHLWLRKHSYLIPTPAVPLATLEAS